MTTPSSGYSRRQLLRTGALAADATTAGLRLRAQSSGVSSAAGSDFWQQVRAQFSFDENRVPMNAANLCPSFRAVAAVHALVS